jgi:transcriptional regulator with XRE-family HTH domain
MTSPTQLVAANIRAEVARRRISQKVLAEALGKSPQSISMRLAGTVAISLEELATIADVLGVTVASLVSESAQAAS